MEGCREPAKIRRSPPHRIRAVCIKGLLPSDPCHPIPFRVQCSIFDFDSVIIIFSQVVTSHIVTTMTLKAHTQKTPNEMKTFVTD